MKRERVKGVPRELAKSILLGVTRRRRSILDIAFTGQYTAGNFGIKTSELPQNGSVFEAGNVRVRPRSVIFPTWLSNSVLRVSSCNVTSPNRKRPKKQEVAMAKNVACSKSLWSTFACNCCRWLIVIGCLRIVTCGCRIFIPLSRACT